MCTHIAFESSSCSRMGIQMIVFSMIVLRKNDLHPLHEDTCKNDKSSVNRPLLLGSDIPLRLLRKLDKDQGTRAEQSEKFKYYVLLYALGNVLTLLDFDWPSMADESNARLS